MIKNFLTAKKNHQLNTLVIGAADGCVNAGKEVILRYVREWLGIVTCGGFVETDESGEQFWLKPEYRDVISGPNATFMLKIMNMIGIYANMEKNIENVFKKDGPRGQF